MSKDPVIPLVAALLIGACSSGPPAPPTLAYGVEDPSELQYEYGDTTTVSISMMGQGLEVSQEGSALLDVSLRPLPGGLDVSLTVNELDATILQPMGGPVRIGGAAVSGALAFTLDRNGDAEVRELPEVSDEASQLISGLDLAHALLNGAFCLGNLVLQVGNIGHDRHRYFLAGPLQVRGIRLVPFHLLSQRPHIAPPSVVTR